MTISRDVTNVTKDENNPPETEPVIEPSVTNVTLPTFREAKKTVKNLTVKLLVVKWGFHVTTDVTTKKESHPIGWLTC